MRKKWIAFGLAMMLALQPTALFASEDDESHLEELEEQKSEVESKETEADAELSETQARVDEYIEVLAELDGENCTQEKILTIIAEGAAAAGGEA